MASIKRETSSFIDSGLLMPRVYLFLVILMAGKEENTCANRYDKSYLRITMASGLATSTPTSNNIPTSKLKSSSPMAHTKTVSLLGSTSPNKMQIILLMGSMSLKANTNSKTLNQHGIMMA